MSNHHIYTLGINNFYLSFLPEKVEKNKKTQTDLQSILKMTVDFKILLKKMSENTQI